MQQETLSSQQHNVAGFYEAIELYYDKGWTDGLPVVPPTEELVRQFLAACGRQPSDVVGVVPTRGRAITAEKIAVNAVMAGCRPEYMPVLIAVVEAMTEPEFNYHGCLASTMGSAPMIIVNGPIVKELDFNAGVNVFGPGWRANATIGRAVRLIIINLTDGTPGLLDRSTLGHGGKYSMCIAENEDASPWEPLHVQRGMSPTDSAVSVFAVLAPLQVSDAGSNTPEAVLENLSQSMSVFTARNGQFLIVLPPEIAQVFGDAGWSKRQATEYLQRRAVVTSEQLSKRPTAAIAGAPASADPDASYPVVSSPDGLFLLVAGGDAGGFCDLIVPWGGGNMTKGVTKLIRT